MIHHCDTMVFPWHAVQEATHVSNNPVTVNGGKKGDGAVHRWAGKCALQIDIRGLY